MNCGLPASDWESPSEFIPCPPSENQGTGNSYELGWTLSDRDWQDTTQQPAEVLFQTFTSHRRRHTSSGVLLAFTVELRLSAPTAPAISVRKELPGLLHRRAGR